MSLVAYASSDDSEQSDTEEITGATATQNAVQIVPAATEARPGKEAGTGVAPDSDVETQNSTKVSDNDDIENQDVLSLLKGLPQPKNNADKYGETETPKMTEEPEEDEIEEEVKPKLAQMKDAPKPPPKKSKVKITIPALQHDSDEEDQVRKKPKLAPSSGKSGLFSLLPAPIHVSVKETNRTLIPHTLTKKPAQNTIKKSQESTKQASSDNKDRLESKIHGIAGYGSDSDDSDEEGESSNFFSLGNSGDITKTDVAPVLPEPAPSRLKFGKMSLPPPKLPVTETKDKIIEPESSTDSNVHLLTTETDSASGNGTTTSTSGILTFDSTSPNQDAPLAFKTSSSNSDAPLSFKPGSWNTMTGSNSRYSGWYGVQGSRVAAAANYNQYQQPDMETDYNQQFEETVESKSAEDSEPSDNLLSEDFTHDEEFLKMQGKKHRGKEDINIVDVNADDFISTVEITKHLSEETEHRSHKKKDGPTSQQKRKHQITYLAYQAKERELELKNAWSQNRMTKRQTQAKYGF